MSGLNGSIQDPEQIIGTLSSEGSLRGSIKMHSEYVKDAEAWARGTREGVPVDDEDPTYHNNSKWYSEQAALSEYDAEVAASSALSNANAASTAASMASQSRTNAAASATAAAASASSASASATNASRSAGEAAVSASDASGSASQAVNSATSSARSATASADSATQANASKLAASASANLASTKASDAETAANRAERAQESAAASAESAGAYADNAHQKSLDASASARAADASATAAATSERNATAAASGASSSNQTAIEKAAAAAASASAAAGSATSASQSATSANASKLAAAESATLAQGYADDASGSATAADRSATYASNSANASANSATAAAGSATSASGSATAAAASERNAGDSATSATSSARTATNKAAEAVTSANSASASATAAANSAQTASEKATAAQTSATNAANSAASATQSAGSASASATSASSSASSASTSATNAGQSATAAANSAQTATTKASEASTSARNASTSATLASGSADNASASATQASDSASQAGSSATEAAGYASTASSAATRAANSATSADTSATNASQSSIYAANHELNAEAWAVGKRNGIDVELGDETYHNNSKYYSDLRSEASQQAAEAAETAVQASTSAIQAADSADHSASVASSAADTASTAIVGIEQYTETATASAESASSSKSDAEAWAIGKRNGVDVDHHDVAYENNSKYYADQVAAFMDVFVIDSELSGSSDNPVKNKVVTNAIESIDSRMDAFISSQTPGTDSEIRDIRVGYDGTIYQTAGTAVREQISDAHGAFEESQREQNISIQTLLDAKVDSGYVEDGVAYFTGNGVVLFSITGIGGGGGGGGGGGNNAVLTLTNTSGWLSKTISEGSDCVITATWSSIEEELPTGDGTLTIHVNGSTRLITNVAQGPISVDVGRYLGTGTNVVRLSVSDVYNNTKTINYTVNVVVLSIKSSFDAATPKEGSFIFNYTPVGNVEKTVYFIVDGTTIGTDVITASGRQQSYTIPAQTHGNHSLRVYFEAEIDSQVVRSNELFYDVICIVSGNNNPVISTTFSATTAEQYTMFTIPFIVYDPARLTTTIEFYANGTKVSEQTVDRTEHTWSYRADEVGDLELELVVGNTTRSFELEITESSIDAHVTTNDMVLSLQSVGRSNSEQNPDVWEYEGISCVFTGFNHSSDGWQLDEENNTVLRVSGDARLTIPYKMFEYDFRTSGKTIEIEFATRDVLNYDAQILSCMNDNRGLSLTAQGAELRSEQSSITTQYKENEHIRLSFVVEKRSENRLMYVYLNGIITGVIQYPANDDFSQAVPQNISIGSNYCTMDIYSIRVYDNDLTRYQMLDNWIADVQNVNTMLARYNHNNVYDQYDNVVIAKLPADLPYMVISCPELPQYKGDKKTCDVTYVDPVTAANSFTATGVQIDVQGTSSQYYARKNYKMKYKNGFTINGETVSKYKLRANSVPTNTFTMKADVASSEGANNVELARLYNDVCPYKTPAQMADAKVRQGIDGFPVVMFWDDGTNTTFLGKANFNNDKGTEEVFGFVDGDESWEILNNTSDRVIWKNADYTGSDWLNDFEARYPDEDPPYEDPAQLAEFAAWVRTTDRDLATGDAFPNPVVIEDGDNTYVFTHDTEEYRLAKFKAEAGNYMEVQSALFYYLFTELFLMVDSRAKNAFPSFMGSEVSGT